MNLPISTIFRKRDLFCIIDVQIESPLRISEKILMPRALEIIQTASQFKGLPYHDIQNSPSKSNISISFALVFPTEADLNKYRDFILEKI